ncbi:MAG: MASE1 domain-containing protein [Methylocapsa sp.]|nr:MASE1 domain-containing protein [Methylocapsa sp.]
MRRTTYSLGLADLGFWLTGAAFLIAYLALNELTVRHTVDGFGITLWSPDNGLSLALLMEGAIYAPFVLLGAIGVDLFVAGQRPSLGITIASEIVLTVCYAGLAALLRHRLKFDLRNARLSNILVLLSFLPAGVALTSFLYCAVLYAGGSIPPDQFFVAIRHFWMGDMAGMVTIIPLVTLLLAIFSMPAWHWPGHMTISYSVFILATCLAFAAVTGGLESRQYHIFYLLFLPIIWIGMREGYAGAAVGLFAIELGLVAAAAFIRSNSSDFFVFQTLMLVLSLTGLLLGAVTSERRIADQLLREQQLELARMSAFAQAGAMGSALAHELSQPLSTVAAYLHAARRLLQAGISRGVKDMLVKAEAEAQKTREAMERIRELVSNGKMDFTALDLPALARRIVALCRDDAAARGVQIEIEGHSPVPPVRADKLQIEQVLNNLVVNAIDAASERMCARGRVIIKFGTCGDRVILKVEDDGPGVAPEIADRMFQAYQSTKPRGMGLGLHLSQQIVQRHAGRLWWERGIPDGTRFLIELPINGPG